MIKDDNAPGNGCSEHPVCCACTLGTPSSRIDLPISLFVSLIASGQSLKMKFAPWLLCQKVWDGLTNTWQHFFSSSETSLNKRWWNIWHIGCTHSVCLSTCAVLRIENSVFLSDSAFLINIKSASFFLSRIGGGGCLYSRSFWASSRASVPVLGWGEAAFELPACSACCRGRVVGEVGGGRCFLWGQTKSGYKTWSVAYETTLPAPSLQIKLTDVVPAPHLCVQHPCLRPQKWRCRLKPCGILSVNPVLGPWRNLLKQ